MIQDLDNNVSLNATTAALPTTIRNASEQFVSAEVLITFGLVVSIAGILANTLVLAVLILARREYGSSVNTLIINQCAMDLFTCVSIVIVYVVMLTHGFVYNNQLVDNILCVAVHSGTFTTFGVTAEKIGLVVITLERYFKIVHAVAHRKHYRNWMTKVGVALP